MFQKDFCRSGVADSPEINKPFIKWKTRVGIQGYLNNPIIVGDRLYVGSSGTYHIEPVGRDDRDRGIKPEIKPDDEEGVYCIDKKTGAIIWHYKTDADACGVAYAGGKIFSTSDDVYLRANDAATGKLLWHVKRDGELYCQPLLIDDLVFIGDETGTIIAARQEDGIISWSKRPCDGNIRGGLSSDGNNIYAAFLWGSVACFKLDGSVIWIKEGIIKEGYDVHGTGRIYGAPTILDNIVVVTYARDTYYDTPAVFALNKQNGDLVWMGTDGKESGRGHSWGNIRSSVVTYKDFIVYGEPYSNHVVALNIGDGSYAWHIEVGLPMFPHYPSGARTNDTLYIPRSDGNLHAIDLFERKVKWQIYLGLSDFAGVTIPEEILCNYTIDWEPPIGFPIYASPAIDSDGTVYVGSGEGYLYAIGEAQHE